MKNNLIKHVRIKYTAEQACWNWYTDEIKNVKTAKHALSYSLRMAGTGSTTSAGAVIAADAELAGKADGVGCSPRCRLAGGASLGFCWSGGHGGCVLGFFKSGSGGGCVEGAECVCSLD